MHRLMLFAHLVGVVVWIGGMFFMTVCLHPSLAPLAGKDRVALVVAVLGRFFNWVTLAIVLIWVSGIVLVLAGAGARMPPGWHLMITAGLAMTVIFAYIRLAPFRRVRALMTSGDLTAVPPQLARIRKLVIANLVLGAVAIAGVTWVGI